jgi:hypothetical protein
MGLEYAVFAVPAGSEVEIVRGEEEPVLAAVTVEARTTDPKPKQ